MSRDELPRDVSGSSDDDLDMGPRRRLDDRTFDAVWSGQPPAGSEGLDDVVAFAVRLRASVHEAAAPTPSPALAELLENGLPGTVDATTPRPASARGRRSVLGGSVRQGVLARAAGLTLVGKVVLATAAVAVTTAGAGFTGVLPIPAAQEAFDRAFRTGAVPVEVPDTAVRTPSDADADDGSGPARSPAGGDGEGAPTPVPGTSAPRDGTSSAREEIPEGIDRTPPSDVPQLPDGAVPPEQPPTSADPEQDPEPGQDPDPLRPDRPAVPSEDTPTDQAGSSDGVSAGSPVQREPEIPARDGTVEDDVTSSPDPAVSGSDPASASAGPDGPAPEQTQADQERSSAPTDPGVPSMR
jgi:hypothetical protein